ncbi:hypothetical protein ACTXT7_005732 [Hymenolepis weldensis]
MAELLGPNSRQSSMTINPAMEFDTRLFQTDTREHSQEFPGYSRLSAKTSYRPPQDMRQAKEQNIKTNCCELIKTVPIGHSTQDPQTPASTMEDHKTSALPDPYQPVTGSQTLQLHQKEQSTRITSTKAIPINLLTSLRTVSPSALLQIIKPKKKLRMHENLSSKINSEPIPVNYLPFVNPNSVYSTLPLLYLYSPIIYTLPLLLLSPPLKKLCALPLFQPSPHPKILLPLPPHLLNAPESTIMLLIAYRARADVCVEVSQPISD